MMSPERSSYHQKNLSVFNLLAFIIVIGLNVLAAMGRVNGRTPAMISAQYETLFTPAGITFSIWGVIYAGLLAFTIYQCWLAFHPDHEAAKRNMMSRLKMWFIWSCVANAGWLIAWHYNWLPLSICIMAFLWFCLYTIQQRFQMAAPEAPLPIKLFVFIPFGLYLGWISIAFIANLAAVLVYFHLPATGTLPVILTILALLLGTALTAYFLLLHNNIPYALVTIWAFCGIIIKRQAVAVPAEYPVIQACVILIGLVVAGIVWQVSRQQQWKNKTAH